MAFGVKTNQKLKTTDSTNITIVCTLQSILHFKINLVYIQLITILNNTQNKFWEHSKPESKNYNLFPFHRCFRWLQRDYRIWHL